MKREEASRTEGERSKSQNKGGQGAGKKAKGNQPPRWICTWLETRVSSPKENAGNKKRGGGGCELHRMLPKKRRWGNLILTQCCIKAWGRKGVGTEGDSDTCREGWERENFSHPIVNEIE